MTVRLNYYIRLSSVNFSVEEQVHNNPAKQKQLSYHITESQNWQLFVNMKGSDRM